MLWRKRDLFYDAHTALTANPGSGPLLGFYEPDGRAKKRKDGHEGETLLE